MEIELTTVNKPKQPWPENAILYHSLEAEQMLLMENASCLAVKAYLKMCDLPFGICARDNAEFMSPGGRLTQLPFLRADPLLIAEFERIVEFVEEKGIGIGQWLTEDKQFEVKACVTMVENVFTLAEAFISFVNTDVYNEVTKPRYGSVFPWPLNIYQNYKKKRNTMRMLRVYQWDDITMEEVVEKVHQCCEMLQMVLGQTDDPFFCSNEPCELDAVAFGHLYAVLTTKLPNMELAQTVQEFEPLVKFCRFIDEKYFQMNLL